MTCFDFALDFVHVCTKKCANKKMDSEIFSFYPAKDIINKNNILLK
jgi:hypothetical protein